MVFDFFDRNLPEAWEIYVQPHMNGLRPDFVLLNPSAGIAVFEIKDWNLDAVTYEVELREGKSPRLLGKRNGETFSLQSQNPIEKIHQYKQEIFKLYCPRLAKQFGYATITAGVIFPFADDARVHELFRASMQYRGMTQYPEYSPVSGRGALARGDLSAVFPEGRRSRSLYMTPEYANDLRYWLREPDFTEAQRQPLELDNNQRVLATSRTQSGYRRIKGSAGSGKSLVLAARAAELVRQNKDVLVVTFNITLLHYLMDVAVRWGQTGGKTRNRATWLNFHAWCSRVCIAADMEKEYQDLWKEKSQLQEVLKYRLAALVSSILDNDEDNVVPRYDAILVDEGQDYQLSWWDTLRKACKPGGEMLLVADATQDIYETASAWTDEAMSGAGFAGPWSNLDVSYRMPKKALNYARDFALRFLPKENINIPVNDQASLELEPTQLRWVHTVPEIAIDVCRDEITQFFTEEKIEGLTFAETTFLCSSKQFGMGVVNALEELGINSVHTYDRDKQESRRQKVGFYMGDARVKATTLHSFKGWESRLLVLYIGGAASQQELALVYTGLTRLKRSMKGSALTVISTSEALREYGETWPEFEHKVPF
ncbi:AAA family ATPase [Pseudidiomarina terrestris]|nr:AAA family ATPase [Pseudidiomarina sp. 1APR75-15]